MICKGEIFFAWNVTGVARDRNYERTVTLLRYHHAIHRLGRGLEPAWSFRSVLQG